MCVFVYVRESSMILINGTCSQVMPVTDIHDWYVLQCVSVLKLILSCEIEYYPDVL